MYHSPTKNILSIIGLIVVLSLLVKLIGGLVFFVLKFLLPIILIVWLVRCLVPEKAVKRRYYR